MFGFGKKKLRFPFIFLFMKSEGANFARVCIIILGNWWYRNFVQQGLIFLENDKNWFPFVFTVLPKHVYIQIKSLAKYKSMCDRVVKSSYFSTALSSYNLSIRGPSLESARVTHKFFYNFELEYCRPVFSLLIYYISYHIIILLLLTDRGFA